MRNSILSVVLLVASACAGDAPSNAGQACTGALYDLCLQEHECGTANPDCHNFASQGFQVCSKPCTVGDDASCGMTLGGQKATCVEGVCTPPAANDCTLAP